MGKPLDTQLKESIVSYWERNKEKNDGAGPTYSSMEDIFGVKRNTILRLIKRYKERGSVENLPKGHRQRYTTKRQDRQIILSAKRNPFLSAG